MCNPLAVVAAGVSIAKTTAQYVGQREQVAAERSAMSKWSMAQSENVVQSADTNYRQGQQQIIYHNDQAAQQMQQEDMSARAAAAASLNSAAGAGVDGTSVQALQQEYENRKDAFNTDVAYNRKASDNELQLQMLGFQNTGQSQLNNIQSHYLPANPSPFQPIAQVAGAGLSAYTNYLKIPTQTLPGTNPYANADWGSAATVS